MRYVLKSEKNPECYLTFPRGSSPKMVGLRQAKKFESASEALGRLTTVPKNLNIYGPWKAVSIEDMVGSVEQNKEMIEIDDYKKKISESVLPIRQILGNRKVLSKQLNNLELISQDIDHYIEFHKLNVSSAYWAYKIKRTIREKRREIKDKLDYIDYLQTASMPDIINNTGAPKVKNRSYVSRSSIGKQFINENYLSKDLAEDICRKIEEL